MGDSFTAFDEPLTGANLKRLASTVPDPNDPLHWQKVDIDGHGTKLASTGLLTASGDTDFLAPTAGMALRVSWVYAVNDPDAATSPRIRFKFGAGGDPFYDCYAIAHREVFQGEIDDHLFINLDQAGSVAVTVHYVEV